MKQIEVQIMDQSYLLGCPEGGEAQLREAVERVDTAMCRIRDAGKVRARDRIAVLASLNLAFDLGVQLAVSAEAVEAATVAAATQTEAPQAVAHTTDTSADEARAADLIRRLDQALAGDGHLL
ncbi:MAG: cell division protein ZapA [Pseudomonadota bacterium]